MGVSRHAGLWACASVLSAWIAAGCGGTGSADAGAMDAAPDASAPHADAGFPDEAERAERCDERLAARRTRCGEPFCHAGECPSPGECGDVLFGAEGYFTGCAVGERIEDECGSGCLARRGGPTLCGTEEREGCGPDAVCTTGCAQEVVGECEPRPTTCDAADARLTCLCGDVLHWDGCEARREGLVSFQGCNIPGLLCDVPEPLTVGSCETPELLRWRYDGERCIGTMICQEQGYPDEASCTGYYETQCPNGTRSSVTPCRSNDVCGPSELCLYPPDDPCGLGGAMGRCQLVPLWCFARGTPNVCGCDGVTYGGVCRALVEGTAILRLGACEAAVP